jgi:hypothetical protein
MEESPQANSTLEDFKFIAKIGKFLDTSSNSDPINYGKLFKPNSTF